MIEKAKKHKKGSISEEDIATVLRRYTATTVLALLQEVAHCTDVKIDWNALVERTSTGITNPREYQMLWRHLAYRGAFLDKIEDEAQPLDDDSDLEYELEAFPAVSSEASTEATACVKVLLASGLPSDSSLPNGPTVEAPLTINIPNFQSSRALESLQPPCSMQGMNITVPVSVQKQPAPSGTVAEGSDASGPASSSMFPRRRRKPWSEAEDMELISAVQKCGEGNWANILKGDFKGDRTAAQLSQRWAIIRKRHGNLNTGGSSTGTQLSEAQLAARHAVSLALNMPVKNLTANAIGSGTNATSNLAGINATSNLARANATSNSAGANVTNNSVGTNATGNSAGMNAASNSLRPTFSSESSVAGSSSSFAQAQKQSQQSVVAAKPSPAGSLGCAAKSRIITKKPSVKSVSNSDATVRAMAVAAGARIASPSDAASLYKAAQAKNAVHIMPTGGAPIKSSVPGGVANNPEAHPNGRYICPGMSATPVSPYPAASSSASHSGSVKAVSSTTQHTVSTDPASLNVLSKQTNEESCTLVGEPSIEEVKSTEERTVTVPGDSTKDKIQGDGVCVSVNVQDELVQEDKVGSPKQEAKLKVNDAEADVENPVSSLNVKTAESNHEAVIDIKPKDRPSENGVKISGSPVIGDDNHSTAKENCENQNKNEMKEDIPVRVSDGCSEKLETLGKYEAGNEI
ncbi:hypothetical protein FEM48_Zijuj06G0150800 [Ziziphus jujuba var. spinosa]|uniref:Uncharacterized protein n=1 Tax=Ziziphus jujuba var. spinosa TaxID=714518 RepID=A0A978V9Z8_ZIZJJ|nr:hypothetical protein FEM48_Zijuj06G0150800 [Ziziphus jujuba var. spinosa]